MKGFKISSLKSWLVWKYWVIWFWEILGLPDPWFERMWISTLSIVHFYPFKPSIWPIYISTCRLMCWVTSIKIHKKDVPFSSPHGAIYAVSTHCYSFSSLISSWPRRNPKLRKNWQGEIQIPIDGRDSLLCRKLPGYIPIQLVTYNYRLNVFYSRL